MVLWGVCLRVESDNHATWLVNSATHMWGARRFRTRDDSRNNWWVALMTFGEGWHNNHHAHPTSARHGLAWYEIDMSWMGIRLLQLLGPGEQTVSQLASHFTVSRSAISQHLGVLADSGLVTSRRAGKFQYYRLNARGMAALRAELDSFWTRELDQLVRDARAVP